MHWVRNFITYCAFPLNFFGAQALALWWMGLGWSQGDIIVILSVSTAVILLAFERIHPFHPVWNRSQKDIATDSLHVVVSQVLLPKYGEMALQLLWVGVAVWLVEVVGGSLWPSHWHLYAQLALALVLGQFFEYWTHRGMHEVPLLWRLHATHHSPGRLYWLNAARFHPLDASVSVVVSLTPIILLGAGSDVVTLIGVWVAVHGLYQHCNVRLRLGPLNYIFSMAELHRWHHSLKLEEANTNYGNNIILWDLVFGTFYYPKDREPSADIGLSDIEDFPKGYWGQLLSPFRWSRLQRRKEKGG